MRQIDADAEEGYPLWFSKQHNRKEKPDSKLKSQCEYCIDQRVAACYQEVSILKKALVILQADQPGNIEHIVIGEAVVCYQSDRQQYENRKDQVGG